MKWRPDVATLTVPLVASAETGLEYAARPARLGRGHGRASVTGGSGRQESGGARAPASKAIGLLLVVAAIASLPALGAAWRTPRWTRAFDVFPPDRAGSPKPQFSALAWVISGAIAVGLLVLFLAPSWLGFRASGRVARRALRRPPWWFWLGAACNLGAWALMWWGSLPFAAYAFVPLWWGFIVAIDGIVYARRGQSLLARRPRQLLTLGLVSIPAWSLFEFLNYYVDRFWVYPYSQIFSPLGQALWYLLSFSTVWPAVAEWFTLLESSPALATRWRAGPALQPSRGWLFGLLAAAALSLILLGAFPDQAFLALWLGPVFLLATALPLLRVWTPFRAIRQGDWSACVLMGLAALANGFFWELWNYGSEFFHQPGRSSNPNYWYYDVPYVNRFHPFSEMPLLGYFGYVPFGLLVWLLWSLAAELLGFQRGLALESDSQQGSPQWSS